MQNFVINIIPLAVVVLIFYLVAILPMKKQEQKRKEMLNNLKRGDKVVTVGGIYGMISNIKDDVITLSVGGNVKIDFERSAIAKKIEE